MAPEWTIVLKGWQPVPVESGQGHGQSLLSPPERSIWQPVLEGPKQFRYPDPRIVQGPAFWPLPGHAPGLPCNLCNGRNPWRHRRMPQDYRLGETPWRICSLCGKIRKAPRIHGSGIASISPFQILYPNVPRNQDDCEYNQNRLNLFDGTIGLRQWLRLVNRTIHLWWRGSGCNTSCLCLCILSSGSKDIRIFFCGRVQTHCLQFILGLLFCNVIQRPRVRMSTAPTQPSGSGTDP